MSATPITDLIEKLSPGTVPLPTLEAARAAERAIATSRVSAEERRDKWRLKKQRQRAAKAECPPGQKPCIESSSGKTQSINKKKKDSDASVPGDKGGQATLSDWPKDYREQFWARVPRKASKADAMRALDKVRRSGLAWAVLWAGVTRWAKEAATQEPRYVKHPSTWLNKGCWDDEPLPFGNGNGGGDSPRPRRGGGNAFARRRAASALQEMAEGEDHETASTRAREIGGGVPAHHLVEH